VSAGSRRLPYSHHVDDRTLALRDDAVQVIRLDGLLFETADTRN
jgi:type IV secretory pathway VirB4 component